MQDTIQQTINKLLLEHGRYEPLELLLREGHLFYEDYEAWRNGKVEYLDEVLTGNSKTIHEQMEVAEVYARELGLEGEPGEYPGWGEVGHAQLHFSQSRELEQRLCTWFIPPQNRLQMDLFMDSPATNLIHSIHKALVQQNPAEARHLHGRLYNLDAAHTDLDGLERLIEAQENSLIAVQDVAHELALLETGLSQLASAVLRQNSRDYLIPFWRRLSAALNSASFNPEMPELHRSYTDARALDWQSVRKAVETEPGWIRQPVLLARHIHSCAMLHDESASLLSCFRLCWNFPKYVNNALNNQVTSILKNAWLEFHGSEPELPTADFPAWLLLRHPGLVHKLPSKLEEDAGSHYPGWRAVYGLQYHPAAELDKNHMKLRQQLQQYSPDLFNHFMQFINQD